MQISRAIFFHCTIYFLLSLDTVNLFATENASGMRYRKKTLDVILDVWALVVSWKMDKRFCRDEKFSSTVLEDKESKEYFNPQLNKPRINFAVPSDQIKKTV